MKDYIKKVKFILPVYLLIYIATTALLYSARLILEYKLQLLELDVMLWNFWIPAIVVAISTFIFLRPRLRVLTFKKKTEDRRPIFFYLSLLGMFITCSISQHYLYDSTGDLIEVSFPSQINNINKAKFYKIKRYGLKENEISLHRHVHVSGKHNNDLNFDYYFVLPMVDSRKNTAKEISNVWFLKTYHEQISNRKSDNEKNRLYKHFNNQYWNEMDSINFNEIEYFERVPSSEERKFGLKAIDRITPVDLNGDTLHIPILLKPISRKFEDRVGNKLYWIFGSFGIVTTIFLLLLIWPNFSSSALKKIISGKGKTKNDFSGFLEFFIPKKDQFVTAIILNVNILVFITMWLYYNQSFLSHNLQLLHWGANRRFEVLDSEWWRLLTNIFLHGGIMHLIYNSIAFVLVAIILEPMIGRLKFFVYYLICGILASVLSIIYYDNILSVGASGAIFGLFGILIYLEFVNSKKQKANNFILYYFGGYLLINLIYGLIVPGIDNAAHFGGFFAGLLVGYLNTILDSEDEFKGR